MKRFGEPEEIGELVLFMCSDACDVHDRGHRLRERWRRLAVKSQCAGVARALHLCSFGILGRDV